METTATILHADLDAFYASVLDPSLCGKPIVVGGGVVLAASYEAKAFGIRGGMPGWRARELCPQLIFVGGHFKDYQRLGDAVIKVLYDFTPLVERISIDEAFADVAGCIDLFGSPAEIATAIRRRVRAELGLAISVGVRTAFHNAETRGGSHGHGRGEITFRRHNRGCSARLGTAARRRFPPDARGNEIFQHDRPQSPSRCR